MKILLRIVGALFIAVGLFWFGRRDGIARVAAQCRDGRLRRGRHSLRVSAYVVRVAVI